MARQASLDDLRALMRDDEREYFDAPERTEDERKELLARLQSEWESNPDPELDDLKPPYMPPGDWAAYENGSKHVIPFYTRRWKQQRRAAVTHNAQPQGKDATNPVPPKQPEVDVPTLDKRLPIESDQPPQPEPPKRKGIELRDLEKAFENQHSADAPNQTHGDNARLSALEQRLKWIRDSLPPSETPAEMPRRIIKDIETPKRSLEELIKDAKADVTPNFQSLVDRPDIREIAIWPEPNTEAIEQATERAVERALKRAEDRVRGQKDLEEFSRRLGFGPLEQPELDRSAKTETEKRKGDRAETDPNGDAHEEVAVVTLRSVESWPKVIGLAIAALVSFVASIATAYQIAGVQNVPFAHLILVLGWIGFVGSFFLLERVLSLGRAQVVKLTVVVAFISGLIMVGADQLMIYLKKHQDELAQRSMSPQPTTTPIEVRPAPTILPSPSLSTSPSVTVKPTAIVMPTLSSTPSATATPPPIAATAPSPEPPPSPLPGPSFGPNWSGFTGRLKILHKGYKTYSIQSPAGIGMCDFYLRLGMEENTPKVHVALYVRTTYCAKEIFDTVANNYQTIVEDLKMSVKNDEHILDLNVQPQVYVYSNDNVRPLFIAAGKVRNGISFWVDRDYGPP